MPPKPPVRSANSNESSDEASALDRYGIYRVESYDRCPNTCSPAIKSMFKLVNESQLMPISQFAAPPSKDGSKSSFDTKSGEDYDMLLKKRAEDLSSICNDPDLVEAPEVTWLRLMLPIVLLVFDRKAEERLDRDRPFHHCLACRRHFRPGSRPIINFDQTSRTRTEALVSRPDFELCDNSDHFNLPNFNLCEQLIFPKQGVPDVTVGLGTYNLKREPWCSPEMVDLVQNDRVRLFDKDALVQNLAPFGLAGPNVKNKPHFVSKPHPLFNFGLWEAKKATGDTHDKAFLQTADKVQTLLKWQRDVFNKAKLCEEPECEDLRPLVWFLSSVGSDWQLWGCFEETLPGDEDYQYPMVLLWTGKITDKHRAFQLLYIIDIIRFWAEFTYKPIICSCLHRLEELRLRKSLVPINFTMWDCQIPMNEANTPWLFHRRDAEEATFNDAGTASTVTTLDECLSPPSSKTQRRSIDQSVSPSRKPFDTKSSNGQARKKCVTVVPASEEYNWLLDRSIRTNDHLMIRISRQGGRGRPCILFDDTKWHIGDTQNPERKLILEQERLRYEPNVRTGFTYDMRPNKYLWSCARSTLDYLHKKVQFCAIVPLNKIAYGKQPVKKVEEQLFEPIEALLHIGMLLASFEAATEQWCKCQRLVNGFEPGMIHCGNARCHLQWYHKECVDLDEDDEPEPWMCPDCRKMPRNERKEVKQLKIPREYEADIEASDQRVQRTRALHRVWDTHPWPSKKAIFETFERVLYNLDIIESSNYKIRSQGIVSSLSAPRYWVLKKDEPKAVIRAGPRERQIVEHEQIDSSDDEESSEETDNQTPDYTNNTTDDFDATFQNLHV